MSDTKKGPTDLPQQPANQPPSNEPVISKKLEKEADEMAGRAGKAENRYDQTHDIFTK